MIWSDCCAVLALAVQQTWTIKLGTAHVRGIWKEYSALVEATPATHRHVRIHAGHCTSLLVEPRK